LLQDDQPAAALDQIESVFRIDELVDIFLGVRNRRNGSLIAVLEHAARQFGRFVKELANLFGTSLRFAFWSSRVD